MYSKDFEDNKITHVVTLSESDFNAEGSNLEYKY